MKDAFITGKKIILRGLKKEDLRGNMFNWANDSEVTYYMYTGIKPNHIELLEEEYDKMIRNDKEVVFAIVDKKTKKHIGNVGLYSMSHVYHSAEYRILIGEKQFWGKGFGSEAAKLVLEYGFDKLNLHKIWLGVNAENKGAVKSYKNAGFVEEGTLRQEIYRNGKYYDAVRMSILRKEYYGKKA